MYQIYRQCSRMMQKEVQGESRERASKREQTRMTTRNEDANFAHALAGEGRRVGRGICPRRFTLIELLVVIAIISILASMLFPALSSARNQALTIACATTMKQHGSGVAMYQNDYNSWLPISIFDDGLNGRWKQEISSYVGVEPDDLKHSNLLDERFAYGIFKCSKWLLQDELAEKNYKYNSGGGYGWNYYYMGFREHDSNLWRERQKMQHVEQPTETIAIGDTTDWLDDPANLYRYATIYPYAPAWKCIGNRHNNGINLLMLDGHVDWKSHSELYTRRGVVNEIENYYYKKLKTAQGY